MWSNIESGAFGKYGERLALLVFEGKSKIIEPKAKYFKREVEHILPPKTVGRIVKKYETQWRHPGTGKIWIVDVYHLMILPQSQVPTQEEFHFGKDGYIRSVPEGAVDHTGGSGMYASTSSGNPTAKSSKKKSSVQYCGIKC